MTRICHFHSHFEAFTLRGYEPSFRFSLLQVLLLPIGPRITTISIRNPPVRLARQPRKRAYVSSNGDHLLASAPFPTDSIVEILTRLFRMVNQILHMVHHACFNFVQIETTPTNRSDSNQRLSKNRPRC